MRKKFEDHTAPVAVTLSILPGKGFHLRLSHDLLSTAYFFTQKNSHRVGAWEPAENGMNDWRRFDDSFDSEKKREESNRPPERPHHGLEATSDQSN